MYPVPIDTIPTWIGNVIQNFLPILVTVNSGELRIPYPVPYPVPVCVTGNLWLVKFNVFIL